jgi:hypothetical protein
MHFFTYFGTLVLSAADHTHYTIDSKSDIGVVIVILKIKLVNPKENF